MSRLAAICEAFPLESFVPGLVQCLTESSSSCIAAAARKNPFAHICLSAISSFGGESQAGKELKSST